MKVQKNFFFFLLIFSTLFVSKIKAQDMMPEPIKIEIFDMMEGEWVSDPYDMMGTQVVETVSQHWAFNHQYFVVDMKAEGYEGRGYMTSLKDGEVTGWWFDGYGPQMMTEYSGKIEGSRLVLTGKNPMSEETREIDVMGDVMTHRVTYTMNGQTYNNTVTYRKKM